MPVERWSLFCKLTNLNGDFVIYFFRDDALGGDSDPKTMTDEEIIWMGTGNLFNTLPNLHWLIPMANIKQNHDWIFSVMERT